MYIYIYIYFQVRGCIEPPEMYVKLPLGKIMCSTHCSGTKTSLAWCLCAHVWEFA